MGTSTAQSKQSSGKKTKNSNYITFLNEKAYPWLESKIGYKRTKDFAPIDFNKHWIHLYKPVMPAFVLDSFLNTLYFSMYTYWPLVIFWGIANNLNVLFWYAIAHMIIAISLLFSGNLYLNKFHDLSARFDVNITRFFLTSDPINHAQKSSGKIRSKVGRAQNAIGSLIGLFGFNLIPTVFELASVSLAFFAVSLKYGAYTTTIFVIMTLVLVFARRFLFSPILKWAFRYVDAVSAVSLEILQQQNYIRTAMASDLMMEKFNLMNKKLISVVTTRRNAQNIYNTVVRILWFSSMIGLISMLWLDNQLIPNNEIVVGLLVVYIGNAGNVFRLSGMLNEIYERTVEIEDLYEYIQSFGGNSYPVIPEPEPKSSLQSQQSI